MLLLLYPFYLWPRFNWLQNFSRLIHYFLIQCAVCTTFITQRLTGADFCQVFQRHNVLMQAVCVLIQSRYADYLFHQSPRNSIEAFVVI